MKKLVFKMAVLMIMLLGFNCKKNRPPELISAEIPKLGKVNQPIIFKVKARDPEGEEISFKFDFGDNNQSDWSVYFPSESVYSDTYTYKHPGQFTVQIKIKDIKGKESDWTKLGEIAIAPLAAGEVFWVFVCEEDGDTVSFYSTPIVDEEDSLIFVTCEKGHLHAIQFNGKEKWHFSLLEEERIISSPLMDDYKNIYLATEDGKIISLTKDGQERWRRDLANTFYASPALGRNNEIYFQSEESIFAFSNTGELLWTKGYGGNNSPIVDLEGNVYFVSKKDNCFLSGDYNGNIRFIFPFGYAIINSPFFINNKKIFLGLENKQVVCLDTRGETLWSRIFGEPVTSSGVLFDDTNFYVITKYGSIYKGDGNGNFTPVISIPCDLTSSLAISEDNYLYFRASWEDEEYDTLYCLTTDGEIVFKTPLPGEDESEDWEILASPKIGPDGTVYIATAKGLYAVVGKGKAKDTGWYSFRKDNRNTGRR